MKKHIVLILLALVGITAQAQAPAGYYNSANDLTGTELKAALHNIIKGHTVVSYAGLLDAFAYTDCDANQKIIDIYSNYHWELDDNCTSNYHKEGDCWNREHTWPQSWFNEKNGPKSDLFHVYPTDGYVNNRRSNYPYGEVSNPSYTSGNGSKLGPCTVSGYSGTVFEPIDEYKGDIARSFFYMSVRYYGEDSDWSSSDMTNKSEIRSWALAMLLAWSDNDPVSAKEMARNNAVYGYQGNRNPFIDNPEYAHMIWDENWSGASYAITCATGLSNGSISAPASATKGTIVSITATPNAGYEVDTYSAHKTGEASTIVTVSSNGTFTMPNYPVTVSATFKQNTTSYPITLGSVTHGSISATTTTALSGATVNLSATPAIGYTLYSWYVFKTGDMNIMIHTGTGNSFTMPAFPVTVLASFTSNSNGNFVRLTSTPSDWSGNYILVYEQSNNTGYVWTGEDGTNCFVSKTITNNTITDDNLVNLTIATMTGGHSIKVNGGTNNGKYIHGTSGKNELEFNTTAQVNTLTFEDNSVKMVSNTSVMRFNTASDQQRFRYFKSDTYTNQQPIQLYKRIVSIPTHSINFYPNGGSGSMGSQSVEEMTPTPLNANAFTREGYLFDGWTTNADGTGTYYIDGASVMTINDINLYAQWIPLYTVTCATGLSHGSIQASPTSAVEGTTITLTATPDTDYEIDAWTVTDENGHSIEVVENQFEMPASNVTVSAGFFPQEAFTAHYYLVTSTDQLVVGRKYLIVNTQYGKALGTTQNDNNRAAVDVSITSNGVIQNIGTTVCQLTLGFENNHWTFFDPSNNGYLYAASSGSNYLRTQTNNDANGQWTISIDANGLATIVAQGENTRNNLRYNRNSPLFSCYASTQGLNDLPLTSLYVRSETCDFTESGSVCLNAFDKNIIHSGVTLNASSVMGINQCTDPSLLIIEDGAQLIHHTDGLKATLKKTIQAYSDGESDGWYTIAAPFSSFSPTEIATGTYDLYYYDEDATEEWINYKSHQNGFAQPSTSGYLYAHSPSTTLRMTGTLKSGNYSETVNLNYGNSHASIKGYNLLGNPTAHDIVFNKTDNVSDGYYYLNNSEEWQYETSNSVPVGRGFLVKANAANQSVTLNPQSKDTRDEKGEYVVIDIDGDKAYVKTNDGVSMPLLSFRGHQPSLWLEREGQPYIMMVRDGADIVELNYKAKEHGIHTLKVYSFHSQLYLPPVGEGLRRSTLHLIDRLTGADIDLLKNSSYQFESSSNDYTSRFQLVFNPNDAGDNDDFAFIDADGNLIVNGDGLLQVYDVLGHQLFSSDVHSSFRIPHSAFPTSVYILRLTTPEKTRIQKIIIN
ncbi:MAG: endonuclease [Bacteroidales bacterium]|nr:endonuclease [Bacteroidales bacterium]